MQHLVYSRLPGLVGLIGVAFAWTVPSGIVHAQAGSSIAGFDNICLTEARRAEAQHGIPEGLLQSISRVEAGRKTVTGEFMPWAWTLNDRGEGLFFDSREAAMRHLETAVAAREHSVDVGCMQVNTKWHMGGFHELGDMLDPVQNADYAAGFLLDLHEAHQSWEAREHAVELVVSVTVLSDVYEEDAVPPNKKSYRLRKQSSKKGCGWNGR